MRGVGTVAIDQVIPDPDQPRSEFSEEAIERLARSINDKGQLSPIHVRWSEEAQKWVVISGERRYRAARRAGLQDIECRFHEEQMSDSEILEQQLIENLLREDLKPIEEAEAFVSLMELNSWTGKQVAEYLHVPASRVSRSLALLRLPADVQARVQAGDVPARSAYEISKLANADTQRELAEKAAEGSLSSEQANRAVRERRGRTSRQRRSARLTFATEGGWRIVASGERAGGYGALEAALLEVLEEVRLRIRNDVELT